jgi:hypothetical protein
MVTEQVDRDRLARSQRVIRGDCRHQRLVGDDRGLHPGRCVAGGFDQREVQTPVSHQLQQAV